MEKNKKCSGCNCLKPLSDFFKNKSRKDGYNPYCRQCSSLRTRNWRDKHREQYKANRRKTRLLWGITPHGIYDRLRMNSRNSAGKKILFTSDQFVEWYDSQPKTCHYCNVTLTFGLKSERGVKGSAKLTIDRKDNSLPYSLDNIVLSCRRCNAIKCFRFTYEQMREIGQRYLTNNDIIHRTFYNNHSFKLKDSDINHIRDLYKSNLSEQDIANLYNMNKSTISNIVNL